MLGRSTCHQLLWITCSPQVWTPGQRSSLCIILLSPLLFSDATSILPKCWVSPSEQTLSGPDARLNHHHLRSQRSYVFLAQHACEVKSISVRFELTHLLCPQAHRLHVAPHSCPGVAVFNLNIDKCCFLEFHHTGDVCWSWRHSKPGWMWLWATWCSWRCPCLLWRVEPDDIWTSLPTQRFHDSIILFPLSH